MIIISCNISVTSLHSTDGFSIFIDNEKQFNDKDLFILHRSLRENTLEFLEECFEDEKEIS